MEEKGNVLPLMLVVLLLILVVVGVVLWKNFYPTSNVANQPATSIPTIRPATVTLKSDYSNPFDNKTQYSNPFADYNNPFDGVK